jgi:hypothetical protein
MAGSSPARSPMTTAAARPPAQAWGGMTTAPPWVWARSHRLGTAGCWLRPVHPVPALFSMAGPGRALRRVAAQGHARGGHRPAAPARVRPPDGGKRTVYEVDAADVVPSLRWATAKVAKTARARLRTPPTVRTAGPPSPRPGPPGPETSRLSDSPPRRQVPGAARGLPLFRTLFGKQGGSQVDTRDGEGTGLADPVPGEPATELGYARRLVCVYGDRLRYVPAWRRWLVWDGQRWAQTPPGRPPGG